MPFWTGNYVGTTTKINADKCVLVKPSVSVDPPVGMSNYFFDRNFLLDIGVQFTIDDDDANNGKKNTTDGVKRNKCKICRKQINCDKMRGHVGYHILKAKDVDSHSCGFCGLQSCSNKFAKNSTSKVESTCEYFYAYGRKPQYSKREKCSNHLDRCEAAGCSAVLWTYHMASHYEQCHSALKIPAKFVLSDAEKKGIAIFK